MLSFLFPSPCLQVPIHDRWLFSELNNRNRPHGAEFLNFLTLNDSGSSFSIQFMRRQTSRSECMRNLFSELTRSDRCLSDTCRRLRIRRVRSANIPPHCKRKKKKRSPHPCVVTHTYSHTLTIIIKLSSHHFYVYCPGEYTHPSAAAPARMHSAVQRFMGVKAGLTMFQYEERSSAPRDHHTHTQGSTLHAFPRNHCLLDLQQRPSQTTGCLSFNINPCEGPPPRLQVRAKDRRSDESRFAIM